MKTLVDLFSGECSNIDILKAICVVLDNNNVLDIETVKRMSNLNYSFAADGFIERLNLVSSDETIKTVIQWIKDSKEYIDMTK